MHGLAVVTQSLLREPFRIAIPYSVTNISIYAFSYCTSLLNITVDVQVVGSARSCRRDKIPPSGIFLACAAVIPSGAMKSGFGFAIKS